MRALRFATCVALVTFFLTMTATAQWAHTNGPYGGIVYSLLSAGTNLYAGTGRGVFVSSDTGASGSAANTGLTNKNEITIVQ